MPENMTNVTIAKFAITKIFDNAYKAKAQTIMVKEATRWIEKSKLLSTKGDKKEEGFYLDGGLTLLKGDSGGKSVLAAKVELQLATWPKKSMFGFAKGGASVEVLNDAKVDRDIEDLLSSLFEDLMTKQVVKEFEGRAKKQAKSR